MSHRLVFIGLSVPVVVRIMYTAGVVAGWLSLVIARMKLGTGLGLVALVLALALVTGILLARVPVYETSRRRKMMILEVLPHEVDPQDRLTPPDLSARQGQATSGATRSDRSTSRG